MTHPKWNNPPNWPAPPAGWSPPRGWQPDPAWGPAPAGWQFTAPRKSRTGLIVGGSLGGAILLTIIIGVSVGGSGTTSSPAADSGSSYTPPAETPSSPAPLSPAMLAQFLHDKDASDGIATEDVGAYATAFDALLPHCNNPPEKVAAFASAAQDDLVAHGIHDETRLTVMQHLAGSVPSEVGPTDCQGISAAYLTLRETPAGG